MSALQDLLIACAQALDEGMCFRGDEIILSAGGSVFFDMSADVIGGQELSKPILPVIRSGCYITHDSQHYEQAMDFILERSPDLQPFGRLKPALEVWAHIQSMPEPGLIIASQGKRDISFDIRPPIPLLHYRKGQFDAVRTFRENA